MQARVHGAAGRATPRRLTNEERRRLLDTARRIVREEGADRLTLGHLAARAGVSKPVAYDHFGMRSGLLIALYWAIDAEQVTTLRNALATGERSPEETAHVLAAAYVHCAADAGGEWQAVGAALAGSEEKDVVYQELLDGYVQLFATALARTAAVSVRHRGLRARSRAGRAVRPDWRARPRRPAAQRRRAGPRASTSPTRRATPLRLSSRGGAWRDVETFAICSKHSPPAPGPRQIAGVASSLTLRAGPDALALVRERGLRPEDVDVLPGASGGAKWLVLAGLDRYLFGEFFAAPRARPLHCIGSSIGSWRLACLAQRDPAAALERGHHFYVHEQRYSSRRATPAEVSGVLGAALDRLLGATGVDEILAHPWARLHVLTTRARGLAAGARRGALLAGFGLAAAANAVARRSLALQFRRAIFHTAGDASPFAGLRDLPTEHHALTRDNLRPALAASGSIPLLMRGVRVPAAGGGALPGTFWDGGILDYHPDLDFNSAAPDDGSAPHAAPGLVLYPHFYAHVVPGWFDRSLGWRRVARAGRNPNFRRALLVAPSDAFVAALPGGKIPDRQDFYDLPADERVRRWACVVEASRALGDELRELVATGRVAEAVRPW